MIKGYLNLIMGFIKIVQNVILEERSICDLVARDRKQIMHTLLDLEAYYNWQLPNIWCILKKVVGAEREPVKLFVRILLVINYHIYTSFQISKDSCRSLLFKLGDTRQGNSKSGAIYRDISCLIFKILEEE